MSQNDELLRWMSKRPIDAQTAIVQFSCYRLAARIRELREDGHNIQTIMIRDGRSAYARYVLVQRKA